MPVTKIRGVNINWQVIGDRGPWIMLTTGGRRGHDEFIPLARKLAARGHRVVLHDRRNTGASDVLIEGEAGEEVIWTEDMHELMKSLGALPAFFGGSSSGARTSILFALRNPADVRGLLLLRVTGGAFAAGRLPENYYGQFIRAAREGGMAAVCATEQYQERIKANPRNAAYLEKLSPEKFIAVMTRWNAIFEAGGHHPVMGVSEQGPGLSCCIAREFPSGPRASGALLSRTRHRCTDPSWGVSRRRLRPPRRVLTAACRADRGKRS